MHFSSYDGLCVGDILEIDAGQPHAETIVIKHFGSIHLVSPLRNGHQRAAGVRRLIEGTGMTFAQFQAQMPGQALPERRRTRQPASNAHDPSNTPTADDVDLDGWETDSNWSERERRHQKERYRRKQRAKRISQREIPKQTGMTIQVRQAEKADLPQWPSFPGLRAYMQSVYGSWRVLTAGGDFAEEYLRVAEAAAKGNESEHQIALEDCACSEASFALAEEKLGLELIRKFPDAIQKELANLKETRRLEGLPTFTGRQVLCFGLRHFYRAADDFENTAAQEAMIALRDAVKRQAPQRGQFAKLLHAIDSNMSLPSSLEFNEAEKLKHLENILKIIPDFRGQWDFYLEMKKADRSYQGLRQRLQDLINRDSEESQRRQQEEAFSKQLGGGGQNGGKGLAGKGDGAKGAKGDKGKKKDAAPSNVDAQVQRLKDQTSMKDSQLSALAGQLKKAGIQPDFKSSRERRGRSDSKGAAKGDSRASSTGAGVKRYNCGKTGHYARDCTEPKRDSSSARSDSGASSATSAERRLQDKVV